MLEFEVEEPVPRPIYVSAIGKITPPSELFFFVSKPLSYVQNSISSKVSVLLYLTMLLSIRMGKLAYIVIYFFIAIMVVHSLDTKEQYMKPVQKFR